MKTKTINDLIDLWVVSSPYPHTCDERIVKACPNSAEMLLEVNKIYDRVSEYSSYVRSEFEKYKIFELNDNESIKNVFKLVKKHIQNELYEKNNTVSMTAYGKLIDIIIYVCYMH